MKNTFRIYLGAFASLLLSGCGLQTTVTETSGPGVTMAGSIHGGQQPVSGAKVYLLAAGSNGYGMNSVSLLTVGDGRDSIGTYVLSDAGGNFTLTGRYTCTPNAQVYLLAQGGQASTTTPANSAIAEVSAIGTCPTAGTFAASVPFIQINEVTTVAAAYALSGFMTGPAALSSPGTTLATRGLANAFATASSLANYANGSANSTVGSNGKAPQAKVNTLANIIAACVNSNGSTSPACTSLFNNAMGGTKVPSDTLTALLNIARNPSAHVAALYALPTAISPFQPSLSAQPNDLALSISFTSPALNFPLNIRADASGNIWFRDGGGKFVLEELSPTGTVLSGTSGYAIGGQNSGGSLALDAQGNAFVGNRSSFSIYKLNANGSMVSANGGYFGNCSNPSAKIYAVALDGSNNVWGSGSGGCTLKISNSGTLLSGSAGFPSTPDDSSGIALDSTNAAWIVGSYDNFVRRVSSTGAILADYGSAVSGPSGIAIDATDAVWIPNHANDSVTRLMADRSVVMVTGAGIRAPFDVSIDGANNVWIANNGPTISSVTNSGAALSGSDGYQAAVSGTARSIEVDGSGNVWTTLTSPDAIIEFVGAATPVARPILPGQLGSRP